MSEVWRQSVEREGSLGATVTLSLRRREVELMEQSWVWCIGFMLQTARGSLPRDHRNGREDHGPLGNILVFVVFLSRAGNVAGGRALLTVKEEERETLFPMGFAMLRDQASCSSHHTGAG